MYRESSFVDLILLGLFRLLERYSVLGMGPLHSRRTWHWMLIWLFDPRSNGIQFEKSFNKIKLFLIWDGISRPLHTLHAFSSSTTAYLWWSSSFATTTSFKPFLLTKKLCVNKPKSWTSLLCDQTPIRMLRVPKCASLKWRCLTFLFG